jgi:hypothetical protein
MGMGVTLAASERSRAPRANQPPANAPPSATSASVDERIAVRAADMGAGG